MKIVVILAHPKKGSFNHAIANMVVETLEGVGHEVIYHDLYEESFDPILRSAEIPKGACVDDVISNHCNEIANADGIIIVHPNWWGQPPALLKGWIDRVIRPGVTYEFEENDSGEGVPIGLLKAKAAIVFNTSNTYHEREMNVFGDPLETIWKNCIFGLCGVNNFYRKMYGVIVTSTIEERKSWLDDVKETVIRYFPKEG
ncbi:NAD(P)H-dependent oxidoreductase [Ruminiclostridium herbifermentans]|uniref:NAD(P)H-dependent oxidoreductase n=1 Tax=Ruminiclostridium herbifermentans TaxID=2488810 RepID=A0A4U7JLW6_9FIRM|nr:NAD(P)H-dependent oxidoreductase [Ruminiclostridium herbifermentans]QNU66258.1 NAD(P)H-dependent oxidoreductase [Ruminiclostridium herbifermentans]